MLKIMSAGLLKAAVLILFTCRATARLVLGVIEI